MSRKLYILATVLLAAIAIGGISNAGGGSGGMGAGGGGGMGGGSGGGGMGPGIGDGAGSAMGDGHGMMGNQGHGMMGYGQSYSNTRYQQPRSNPTYQQSEKRETERLRSEIRAKRQELSDLYRSEQPNKEMIDQKIAELDELEAKLDERRSSNQ